MTTVSVLGHLRVATDADDNVSLAPQSRRLLALLASHPGHVVDREELAEGLWGSADAAHLRTLQVHVSHLRTALGRAAIELVDQGYRLALEGVAIDEVRFRSLVAAGQDAIAHVHYDVALDLLGEALDLWRGEPYADLSGDVVSARRAGLREMRLAAEDAQLRAMVEMIRRPCDAESVIPLAAQRLADQSFREARVVLYMRCLMATGRLTDAVNVATDYRRRVVSRAGLEPGPEFAETAARVMRRDPALLPAAWKSPFEVPEYLTPLLERQGEHDVAVALLRWSSVRLLCLTGESGVGKTRMAASIAETGGRGCPGGVIWVPAEHARDSERALAHVAASLGMKGTPAEIRRHLPERLSCSRMLVVLDGVEGNGALPCVSVLLAAGPMVSIIITGTHRLGLASEHELHLRTLPADGAERLVRGLVGVMGGSDVAVDRRTLSRARGLPQLLEQIAIDSLSEGVRA